MDSIPSNECKKVNDQSALGKGAPEFEKCMTPKDCVISPTGLHFVEGIGTCGLQEGFLIQSQNYLLLHIREVCCALVN